jgi:hypothetical protein
LAISLRHLKSAELFICLIAQRSLRLVERRHIAPLEVFDDAGFKGLCGS